MICDITIEQLIELQKQIPNIYVEVETRFGFKKIEAVGITAPDSKVIKVSTENNTICTSPDHLLCNDTGWVKTKDLNIGDSLYTKNGTETITSIEVQKEREDLYDLQVADVKEYYTNNFVSHNSTFLSAITFALFGKNGDTKGESKTTLSTKELINDITKKELEVELYLDSNIIIKRGLKPDYFQIIDKDGKNLADKSSKIIDQTFLENEMLGGISFGMFNKISHLSAKAISTPFVYMPPTQRKEFIENILDIRILYYINEVIKKRNATLKLDMKSIESTLHTIQTHLTSAKENVLKQETQRDEQIKKINEMKANKESLIKKALDKIKNIKSQLVDDEQQISYLESDIELAKVEIEKINKLLANESSINLLLQTTQNEMNDLKNKMIQKKNKKETHEQTLKGFEACGTCPTLKQVVSDFDVEGYNKFIQQSIEQGKELNEKIIKLKNKLDYYSKVKESKNKFVDDLRDLEFNLTEKRHSIDIKNKEIINQEAIIKNLQTQLDNIAPIEVDYSVLNETQTILEETQNKHDELINKFEQLERIKKRTSDKSLKRELLDYYIPIFESKTNELLAVFMEDDEFSFKITLDEDFNIKGLKNNKETQIFKLSAGQQASLNFAVLFAWQYILSIKNSYNMDFLLIDEILDSTLDSSRKDKIVSYLNEISKKHPIFLISHDTTLNKEYFDYIIKVVKTPFTNYIFE